MPTLITKAIVHDIRFPTSTMLDGSDAMNPDQDYSAAYVILETNHPKKLAGHGLTFTIGRGNEVCACAIRALAPMIVGHTLESFTADLGGFWRYITGDSQLRWIGPEKGAIHLATAALVNAVWDLNAKVEGKPLWELLADMPAERLVSFVDPVRIEHGRNMPPTLPGYSTEMKPQSLVDYEFPEETGRADDNRRFEKAGDNPWERKTLL